MEIIARATVLYFFLWLVARGIGKRELSELTAFELILLVTMGDLIQQGVTQEDMSITGAFIAVGTIALWIVLFSYVAFRSPRARRVVEGVPIVVVHDGKPIIEALHIERVSYDDLLAGARSQGIDDVRDVQVGVLEPDGKWSFLKKPGAGDDGDDGGRNPEDDKHNA